MKSDLSPSLLKETRKYVRSYFHEKKNKNFVYHNFKHTKAVVKAAKRITKNHPLGNQEYFVLIISAWLHDVGYLQDIQQHEKGSAQLAEEFLSAKGISKDIISQVKKTILSTSTPQKPQNLVEQILCDADLFHFGTKDFKKRNGLLRKETIMLTGKEIAKEEWKKESAKFLTGHKFFTVFAQGKLKKRKEKNLKALGYKVKDSTI